MRLADLIIERASQPRGPIDHDLAGWVPKLRAARCFEVDATAGELAHASLWANPAAALIRTRDSATLPNRITWFEWRGSSADMGPRVDEPLRPGTIEPAKCGVLVEVDETLKRGVASWVWQLPGLDHLELCPLSVVFDWRPEPSAVPDIIRAAFTVQGADWVQHLRKVHDQSRFAAQDFVPFVAEERRYGILPNPLLAGTWKMLDTLASQDEARAHGIIHGVLRDLENEPVFLAGLVICMNSAGLLDITDPADMTRLNAARRKRGRAERLQFRKISASGRNVIRLSDRGGAVEVMRGFYAA